MYKKLIFEEFIADNTTGIEERGLRMPLTAFLNQRGEHIWDAAKDCIPKGHTVPSARHAKISSSNGTKAAPNTISYNNKFYCCLPRATT